MAELEVKRKKCRPKPTDRCTRLKCKKSLCTRFTEQQKEKKQNRILLRCKT
jgi:hypothetical protein